MVEIGCAVLTCWICLITILVADRYILNDRIEKEVKKSSVVGKMMELFCVCTLASGVLYFWYCTYRIVLHIVTNLH